MSNISPLISPADFQRLSESNDIILIDARTGAGIREKYKTQHLRGALFIDVDTQLAAIPADAANGGRHPLPSPEQFSGTMQSFGIDKSKHVVIYDDKNGANAAARLWWMLRAAGISNVQVLNGGFQAAVNAGVPLEGGEEKTVTPTRYVFDKWELPLATMSDVEKAAGRKDSLVIDVRDKERFDGDKEPIDRIAGHIPGAVNVPFVTNLDSNGNYLSAEKLKETYLNILDDKKMSDVIVHCGSGITACHTLLAMDAAGLTIPSLYVGSWSEWSNNGMAIGRREN